MSEISQSDLDWVMSLDPLSLSTNREKALPLLIRYQRQARAQYEGGIKPKKAESTADAKALLDRLEIAPKKTFLRR